MLSFWPAGQGRSGKSLTLEQSHFWAEILPKMGWKGSSPHCQTRSPNRVPMPHNSVYAKVLRSTVVSCGYLLHLSPVSDINSLKTKCRSECHRIISQVNDELLAENITFSVSWKICLIPSCGKVGALWLVERGYPVILLTNLDPLHPLVTNHGIAADLQPETFWNDTARNIKAEDLGFMVAQCAHPHTARAVGQGGQDLFKSPEFLGPAWL